MKKQKASSSDFDSLLGGNTPKLQTVSEPAPKPKLPPKSKTVATSVTQGRGRPATKGNDVQTSFYYPAPWRKRLKEQALHEDVSVNDLVLEGLRLMFAKRGIDPDKLKK